MRGDPELPKYSLPAGFPPVPGKENSLGNKVLKHEEELNKTSYANHTNHTNIYSNRKRVRRGGAHRIRDNVKSKCVTFVKVFSSNGAGVKNGKVASLNAEVESTQANIGNPL